MWVQSPVANPISANVKHGLMSSLWAGASWPWAELTLSHPEEALLGTPHQCGLVIPTTLYGHHRGEVPEGIASAPCSRMGLRTLRRPLWQMTIHASHARLLVTSQTHPSSTGAASTPPECPMPDTPQTPQPFFPSSRPRLYPKSLLRALLEN